MRKILLFFLIAIGLPLWGQTDSSRVYQGFSGGMMIHTGYLFSQDKNAPCDANGKSYSPQGVNFGLGGAIRVHLLKHLRIGGEGCVSTMNRGTTDCRERLQSGSYIRTGWGGALADAYWQCGKIWPYMGGTIGGGAMRALYIIEGNENDWQEEQRSIFHKQSFFCVDPYVGFDWCMSEKVHMTFRMDWLIALHKRQLVLPTGPRLYIGFMFCH